MSPTFSVRLRRLGLAAAVTAACLLVAPVPGGGPSAVSPGADAKLPGRIAFERSVTVSGSSEGPFIGDIYVINPDGTGRRNLTHNKARVQFESPAWSPDGGQIAFDRFSTKPGIYVMSSSGARLRRLVAGTFGQPAWSPDGDTIAFSDDHNVSTVRIDGTGRRVLIRDAIMPAWSPDGSSIAFVRDEAVYVVGADGTAPEQVTHLSTPSRDPAWSPDGQSIAFANATGIFVVRADGSSLRRIDRGDRDSSPSWSPDGRALVFSRADGLSVVGAGGRSLRRLVRGYGDGGTGEHWSAAWSPAG